MPKHFPRKEKVEQKVTAWPTRRRRVVVQTVGRLGTGMVTRSATKSRRARCRLSAARKAREKAKVVVAATTSTS